MLLLRQKFLCAVVAVILFFPADSSADEHEEKFMAFWKTIEEAANRISWSGEHNMQDVEFVRNELFGDERVYARAWYSDYYVLIRHYRNKDWSSSYISNFWTDSEELIFADGIKVGSPFSKVESYFGKKHLNYDDAGRYRVFQFEESDGGGVLLFTEEDDKVTSIGCYMLDNQTSKMDFLFSLYSGLYAAEVTGEKVNVREYAPDGKVKFQVSRSKGDILLVEPYNADNRGWYIVDGRIINGTLKTVPSYSVSGQFVNVRKITPSERRLFISQYRK